MKKLTFTVVSLIILWLVTIARADEPQKQPEKQAQPGQPKDVMVLNQVKEKAKAVTFKHKLHAQSVPCASCHHTMAKPRCSDCHKKTKQGEAMGLTEAYHEQCIECHKKQGEKVKKKLPVKCGECHR